MRDSLEHNDMPAVQSHLEWEQRVRTRAHELWLARKRSGAADEGSALDDWLQAEREVLGEDGHHSAQSRGATVGNAGKPDPIEQLGEA